MTTPPIIFLDIDGVINDGPWLMRETQESRDFHLRKDIHIAAMDMNPKSVRNLQTIVDATGAKVVISSSWRYSYKFDKMQEFLAVHGFTGEVIDSTPTEEETQRVMRHSARKRTCRGDDIQLWLDRNPDYDTFVILDDSEHMGNLCWKMVKTNFEIGLTEEDAKNAIGVINGDRKSVV